MALRSPCQSLAWLHQPLWGGWRPSTGHATQSRLLTLLRAATASAQAKPQWLTHLTLTTPYQAQAFLR